MNDSTREISPPRQRMLEDMRLRKLAPRTQEAYVRAVLRLAKYLRRAPDTATVGASSNGAGTNARGHRCKYPPFLHGTAPTVRILALGRCWPWPYGRRIHHRNQHSRRPSLHKSP